jgi:hypothetical protein
VDYVDRRCRGLIYVAIPNEKTAKDLKQDSRFSMTDVDLRFPESAARVWTIRRQVLTGAL